MNSQQKTMRKLSLLVLAGLSATNAYAGGYQILEKNTSDLGRAFSGGAAIAEDATTIGSNPAGMALLKRSEFSLSLSLISGSLEVEVDQASVDVENIGSQPTPGNRLSGNAAPSNPVAPAVYAAIPLSERVAVGFGVFSNFSTGTSYDSEFQASILAKDSTVETVNFNPSISYRINEMFSLGFGVNAVLASATISSANPALTAITGPEGTPVAVPTGATAGYSEIAGDDWGYGWNAGALIEFGPTARIGLAYRSGVSFTLEGETQFKNMPSSALYAGFQNFDAEAPLDLPELASLSGYYEFVPAWAVSADISYTGWSAFDKLAVYRKDNGALSTEVKENWRDSYRYAIGLSHAYNQDLSLRTGIAYDETPIPDEYRTLRIPTQDMTWLAVGAQYKINDQLTVDGAYAKIFMDEVEIEDERTFVGQDALLAVAKSKANLDLDILSLQLSYRL